MHYQVNEETDALSESDSDESVSDESDSDGCSHYEDSSEHQGGGNRDVQLQINYKHMHGDQINIDYNKDKFSSLDDMSDNEYFDAPDISDIPKSPITRFALIS